MRTTRSMSPRERLVRHVQELERLGVCRCGQPMGRAPRLAEAKRAAKAQRELRGGPVR